MNKADLKERWGKYCDTDKLVDDMMALLTKYSHRNSEFGVCTVLNIYFANKEPLIKLFQKSPHYMRDMRICLDVEIERENSSLDIRKLCNGFSKKIDADKILLKYTDDSGKKVDDYLKVGMSTLKAEDLFRPEKVAALTHNTDKIKSFDSSGATKDSFSKYSQFNTEMSRMGYITTSVLGDGVAASLQKDVDYKVRDGMKTSRVFNKICSYYGIGVAPKVKTAREEALFKKYNKEFAVYSDMVSGLKRKLKMFISLNPIDYLTMSFGVNWASCHTIDRTNRRHMPNNYSGMYCGGTESYMLDKTSIITFVHDHVPTNWEDGKLYRNMFHYQDDILIQSRVYPQGNDGNTDLYKVFRNYVQDEMSAMFGFTDTTWKKKEDGRVSSNTDSIGHHYRDYTCFTKCNVSYPKERIGSVDHVVSIGHQPVCMYCGQEDDYIAQGSISHNSCIL